MLVRLNQSEVRVTAPNSEPMVLLEYEDIKDRTITPVVTIDVESECGPTARFWVQVTVKRGRPTLIVTTKPSSCRVKEVSKTVQGTFNRI